MPLVPAFGYDELHFALIVIITIMIGTVTPPVGLMLYIARVHRPDADLRSNHLAVRVRHAGCGDGRYFLSAPGHSRSGASPEFLARIIHGAD